MQTQNKAKQICIMCSRVLFINLLLVLFINNCLFAQTTQYGRVVEMNSNGKKVSGVSVTVSSASDCQPAASDANGVFRLVFSEHQPGDVIRGLRIKKYGYEVVNHHIVHEGWTLTEKDTLKIVMAPEGTVAEARNKYYNYLEEAYLSRYDSTVSMLNEQFAQRLISEEQFKSGMNEADNKLRLSFQNIEMYADQLARLNQDDLDVNYEYVLNTFIEFPIMPMNDEQVSVASVAESEFDFLFKGLDFVEACVFFGDFYRELSMNEDAVGYYTLAIHMYETLNGYEGADFNHQIKQLQSIVKKLTK